MSFSPWSNDLDDELKRLWGEGVSLRLIGKAVKKSIGAVGRRRHFLRLPDRGSPIMDFGDIGYVPREKPDFDFPDFKEERFKDD